MPLPLLRRGRDARPTSGAQTARAVRALLLDSLRAISRNIRRTMRNK